MSGTRSPECLAPGRPTAVQLVRVELTANAASGRARSGRMRRCRLDSLMRVPPGVARDATEAP